MEENSNTSQSKAKMNPALVVGVLAAVLIVGGVIFFNMSGSNQPATENSDMPRAISLDEFEAENLDSEEMNATEPATDVTEIAMVGSDFSFAPNIIRAEVGETIRLTLTSTDMPHDFVIDELEVATEVIQAGESTSIEFTPTEAGEYEFYCSVGGHRQMGMVGTLIVE